MSLTGAHGRRPGQGGGGSSSSLFGTVSGSAVANVMVDGPITIPLMKRTGFRPPFAAAVEAVASTGGPDHAAGDGRGGLRDGRVPRRAVRAGGAVGADPGDALLRRRCSSRCTSRPSATASPACRASRAAALAARDGGARPPVHPHPDRAGRADSGLLGAAVRRWSAALALPAGGAAARHHAQGHRLAQRARARWRTARATRSRWRWPAPAPAS